MRRLAYLRFGALGAGGQIRFAYGAWITVALATLLLATSFAELATYDPELRRRVRAIRILPPIDADSAE